MQRFLILFGLAGSLLVTAAAAHDVKDPVCRMTVDSDTAKWKHRLGSRSFYFCSKDCLNKFAADPQKYEKLAAQLEKQDLHEYVVDFTPPENAVAGQPVTLDFTVRYKKSGEPVKEFERIHERLMHFIMTTGDMRWFEHQHPKQTGDGAFQLTWTFPRPGLYRLYADFTPADGDNQVVPLSLEVGGGEARSYPLKPDANLVKQVGDLRFSLRVQGAPFRMEKPLLLTYTVHDRRGRPVRDMQPFIGAMGHLLAISQNGKEVVHTHSLQAASRPAMGDQKEPFRVTPAMVTEKGPAFSFKLTVPTGGLYKTWAQFGRGGKVYTVPFTFHFADLWAKTPALAVKAVGVQRATVVIDGEYLPPRVSVRAGRPVELTFIRKEQVGCGDVLQFPTLGLKRTLKAGESAVIRFTPRKRGTITFTCGMKMYRGQVAVR